jgi:DNA repair exonuclease SbcCD ATPase subunit
MHIREIHMHGYMEHANTVIKLPKRGVVLVHGENGAGKSSAFTESIATAVFGETLRETPPWPEGGGSVRVVTDRFEATREKKGSGSPKLTWKLLGEAATVYDTPTKAKLELRSVAGDYNVWKRTALFTSADACHFSLATDAERKRLVEAIRGIDGFDAAAKACREELKQASQTVFGAKAKASTLEEKIKGLEARIRDAEADLPKVTARPAPAANPAKTERLRNAAASIKRQVKALRDQMDELARGSADLDANARVARQAAEKLDRDACPACGQGIPHEHRAKARGDVEAAEKAAAEAKVKQRQRAAELRTELDAAEEELEQTRDAVAKAEAAERDAERAARAHSEADAAAAARARRVTELRAELATAEQRIASVQAELKVAQVEVAELEACEGVLGIRGLRAQLLDNALEAVTLLSNVWLTRIFRGVTIKLRSENDKVVLDVFGMASSHGYKACSNGQRRRIDIAVLLAFAELEAASRGVTQGTLLVDELFDGLDEPGVEAVCEMLEEVAADRCVVVISHSKKLAEKLGGTLAAVLLAERGTVRHDD